MYCVKLWNVDCWQFKESSLAAVSDVSDGSQKQSWRVLIASHLRLPHTPEQA